MLEPPKITKKTKTTLTKMQYICYDKNIDEIVEKILQIVEYQLLKQ